MSLELLSFKSLFDCYLQKTHCQLSGLSFANIFVWQDFFQFHFEEIDENLCIFAKQEAGTFLYLPPLGQSISTKAVEYSFERMRQLNKSRAVTRIENVSQEQLKYFPSDKYKIYKKGCEYLYFRKHLASLKGDAYKSKRNSRNCFVKNFRAFFCPYESSMAQECLEVFAGWEKAKRMRLDNEIDLAILEDNCVVHRRVLENFELLDLVGRVVKVDSKIVAYSFGYFVGSEIFCDLLEIADTKYQGLSTYIFNQLCQDKALANVKFINAMDDFAPQNVNRTKMSFRPTVLSPVYTVSLLG